MQFGTIKLTLLHLQMTIFITTPLRNDVDFPTVYRRIYCHKLVVIASEMLLYIGSCIGIQVKMHLERFS